MFRVHLSNRKGVAQRILCLSANHLPGIGGKSRLSHVHATPPLLMNHGYDERSLPTKPWRALPTHLNGAFELSFERITPHGKDAVWKPKHAVSFCHFAGFEDPRSRYRRHCLLNYSYDSAASRSLSEVPNIKPALRSLLARQRHGILLDLTPHSESIILKHGFAHLLLIGSPVNFKVLSVTELALLSKFTIAAHHVK